MQHHLPSINNAYRMFVQEERHKELSYLTNQIESLAYFLERNNVKQFKPHNTYNRNQYNSSFASNRTNKIRLEMQQAM